MHDGVHQQALRIDEDVTFLAFDLLACIVSRRIVGPPFSALLTIGAVVKKLVMYSVVSSELAEDSYCQIRRHDGQCRCKCVREKGGECAFLGDGTGTYGGISGITTLLLDGTHNAGEGHGSSGHDTFVEIDGTDLGNLIGKLAGLRV